jgi:aspartate aminotransferase-like enzyme
LILENPEVGLEERFARHKQGSKKVKETVKSLGLKQLSVNDESSAHGMTAIYLPESIKPGGASPTFHTHTHTLLFLQGRTQTKVRFAVLVDDKIAFERM